MERFLRNLYKKFLSLRKRYFFLDAKRNTSGLENLNLSNRILGDFYNNYEKTSFLNFLENIKIICYSENVFDFIPKASLENWDLWIYLKLLKDERIIKIKRNGRLSILHKDILKLIPRARTQNEIKMTLEKRLRIRLRNNESVVNIFKNFCKFEVKARWDQMPVSVGSAIFLVEKILERLPLKKKFLFLGDDDFISVILTLVDSDIECQVFDADEQVLENINQLALRFNLKIKTKKADFRKKSKSREKFVGFLTNPPYTEEGVKNFMKFGISYLGNDGGIIFLAVGDESIGNRFLFLQDFFTKNNLIIKELIVNKIYYPYIKLYKEDKEILKRLSSMVDKKTIKTSPQLGAMLYVFRYLPFQPRRVKFKKPIYAYL